MGRLSSRFLRFARISALFVALVIVLAGVASFAFVSDAQAGVGIHDDPCPTVAGENTNTCPQGTVGAGYSLRFKEADGSGCGPGKQTFTIDSGLFPPGLTLASSGQVSGTPSESGTFTFFVKIAEPTGEPGCAGSYGEKRFVLPVAPGLKITTGGNFIATIGTPFTQPLSAMVITRLSPPEGAPAQGVVWSVVDGVIPAGLSITNGVLTGTPSAPGDWEFSLQAALDAERVAFTSMSMQIRAPVKVTAPPLPKSEVGVVFAHTLSATGGELPNAGYTWSLSAGVLPTGLFFGPTGAITGKPLVSGTYGFTVSATDDQGRKGDYPVLLTIAAKLTLTTQKLGLAKVGRRYKAKLKTVGGILPKTWRLKGGKLPDGVTFNAATGVFTGKPKKKGTYRVSIEVTDSLGVKSAKTLAIVVRP